MMMLLCCCTCKLNKLIIYYDCVNSLLRCPEATNKKKSINPSSNKIDRMFCMKSLILQSNL